MSCYYDIGLEDKYVNTIPSRIKLLKSPKRVEAMFKHKDVRNKFRLVIDIDNANGVY